GQHASCGPRSSCTMHARGRTAGTSSPTAGRGRSRQHPDLDVAERHRVLVLLQADVALGIAPVVRVRGELARFDLGLPVRAAQLDRKSTRLNSSHDQISYAVFCLKKKKNNN